MCEKGLHLSVNSSTLDFLGQSEFTGKLLSDPMAPRHVGRGELRIWTRGA